MGVDSAGRSTTSPLGEKSADVGQSLDVDARSLPVNVGVRLEPGALALDRAAPVSREFTRKARTLAEAIDGADVFFGLSVKGAVTPAMVKSMAKNPIIFAMANPDPEILPDLAREARPDCVIATGRSDYPNQVNNVLCFPFIFRGALDVGATTINTEMELAAAGAIAELAQAETSEQVAIAYGIESISFGPEYIIPRPFDPRLIARVAPAVAKAAMDSGVATRPIADLDAYRDSLTQFVYHSGLLMKSLFTAAKAAPRRIVYAEGEDERVLRAVQVALDERLVKPILVGRPAVIASRIERAGLRLQLDRDYELVNPEDDVRFRQYWETYHKLNARDGVTQVLDQSRWFAEDVPPLGWDSLGIWFSNWVWNSCGGYWRCASTWAGISVESAKSSG